MTLAELQRGFLDLLLDPSRDPGTAFDADGAAGLAVYRNAYGAQLVACLKDSYERLWAWLGDERFEAAAYHHVAGHPPASWTLGEYGIGFAETIAGLYPDDPEVAEIAALDWALRRAFDGPDASVLDPASLVAIDWDEAVLRFVPTLDLLPVHTNCGAIWTAIAGGETVPAAEHLPQPGWIRVWRVGLQPHFATIETEELAALQLATSGMSFARLCDRLAGEIGVEAAVEKAGQYLAVWLQDQMIAEIA
ncbi:HvfC/BufC N-terminal domain-containing protein [Sphingomonas mali]|uniref:HvfC/BufC N-terminal domain-containing protein n=1 Tax=Sphingomonas mali TaxID=40682 RepID=UPI00082B8B04|nr:DNA-binding domain-containing protein [Sphingomonas mali]